MILVEFEEILKDVMVDERETGFVVIPTEFKEEKIREIIEVN